MSSGVGAFLARVSAASMTRHDDVMFAYPCDF